MTEDKSPACDPLIHNYDMPPETCNRVPYVLGDRIENIRDPKLMNPELNLLDENARVPYYHHVVSSDYHLPE